MNASEDLTYHDYPFEEYISDIGKFSEIIEKENISDVVTMYRGGLVLGTHLSNVTNTNLSIIDYQTYDGSSKEPLLVINKLTPDSKILIVDDLVDSGRTMKAVVEYLESLGYFNYKVVTIFGDLDKSSTWEFLKPKPDKWIRFWWEL